MSTITFELFKHKLLVAGSQKLGAYKTMYNSMTQSYEFYVLTSGINYNVIELPMFKIEQSWSKFKGEYK
jgi:hypothetical protein